MTQWKLMECKQNVPMLVGLSWLHSQSQCYLNHESTIMVILFCYDPLGIRIVMQVYNKVHRTIFCMVLAEKNVGFPADFSTPISLR